MSYMKRRVISLLSTFVLLAAAMCGCGNGTNEAAENKEGESDMANEETASAALDLELVRHEIPAGESKIDNPLKGLVPFQGGIIDFPHSMEWFYLPVSRVCRLP